MSQEKTPCPVCEAVLPELEGMQYCPYCGVLLIQKQEEALQEDLPVEESASEDLPDMAAMKKSLQQAQLAAREKYKALLSGAGVKMNQPEDIYTLVLKSCDNKEVLIECLVQVLTRGETAIRMAVSGMPAVLLYKASREAIEQVAGVLRDVDAVYAVVEGEFDYSSLYKSPYFVRLSEEGRSALKNVPKTMWLGENIKFASDSISLEEEAGYSVFTDNALFFFPAAPEEGPAVMLPAYQMQEIDFWEDGERFFAEWLSRDGRGWRLEIAKQKDYDKLKEIYNA